MARAQAMPDAIKAALALNLLTEEGLPHFHRLIAVYLGDDSHWTNWNNLWTAEEDRHGTVLTDYCKSTRILDRRTLEVMQFAYLKAGFQPAWDKDPYRVFAYTTVQERATQVSHGNTGKICGEYDPVLGDALANVASEEARHFAFYRTMVTEILKRDPDEMLVSLSLVLPGIDMPGHTIPGFVQLADVIRRSEIYGPRDYLKIVQEQLKHWKIENPRRAQRDGARGAGEADGRSRRGSSGWPRSWTPGGRPRPSPSRWSSTANSRWTDRVRPTLALLLIVLTACGDTPAAKPADATRAGPPEGRGYRGPGGGGAGARTLRDHGPGDGVPFIAFQ